MPLTKWLRQAPVLTDGAWGTQLQKRGLSAGEIPDSWNLSHPDRVAEVARCYVEAGSRVILTNTFRSNRIALAQAGLDVPELNRAGVRLSKQAAAGLAAVFASLGPCGKLLSCGEVTQEQVSAAFLEQAQALAEAGADALVVETMADPAEAGLAVAAARKTGLPVIASFVFDSGKDKDRTMMGATPETVAKAMSEAGASAIGANCGLGIQGFIPICRRLKAAAKLPVWIKGNAGLPELVDGQPVYRTSPEQFADCLPALIEAGASFIGGCCGTGPDFITACRKRLDS